MTKEQIEHEVEYQEWIDQLDEKYLEDTEVEEDEEEDNRGEDIFKMDNSMRRAGRAWDISIWRCEGSPDPSEVSSPVKLSVFSNHLLENSDRLSSFKDASPELGPAAYLLIFFMNLLWYLKYVMKTDTIQI